MFYTKHVRVGRQAHVGYFFASFEKPFWISRKAAFNLYTSDLAQDVRITLLECEQDGIPCEYLGVGHVDEDDIDSAIYPKYKIEFEDYILTDLPNNEVYIRCKETGEAGVFNRNAYYNRGGYTIGEFFAKNF